MEARHRKKVPLASSGVHNGVVLASSLGAVRGNYFVAMPGSVIKAAPKQLRHRTAEEQEADRVVLRDLRRTADVLRESGSAKNFEDITEQDWPDGDLNTTAETCRGQSRDSRKPTSFRQAPTRTEDSSSKSRRDASGSTGRARHAGTC